MSNITYHLYNSQDDIEPIIEVIHELQQDGPYKVFDIDDDLLVNYVTHLQVDKNAGAGFIVTARDNDKIVGFLAATELTDHYMFHKQRVGQAIVWWVHKDYRKKYDIAKNLQDGFEAWAKQRGLKYLMGGHYEDENASLLQKMYKKRGYKQIEYSYLKEIE